jgi:hypothetical protein
MNQKIAYSSNYSLTETKLTSWVMQIFKDSFQLRSSEEIFIAFFFF